MIEKYRCLEFDARFAINGTSITSCTGVDCATALLASDVPCALYGGTILPFVDGGTTPTGFEFVSGVKAFEITGETACASNGTCLKTYGTKVARHGQ